MLADGMVGEVKRTGGLSVVQAFVGQTGNAIVKMLDAQGNETDNYDTITGIRYEFADDEVVTIVDDDALPKDAHLEAVGVGVSKVRCTFDGDPGDGLREIILESEDIEVVEPPPGEAVSGEFTVTFQPVS